MWWPKLEKAVSEIEKPKEDKRRITNETVLGEVEDVKRMLVRIQNKLDSGRQINYLKVLGDEIDESNKSPPGSMRRRVTVTLDKEAAEKLESIRSALDMSYNSTVNSLIKRSRETDEND